LIAYLFLQIKKLPSDFRDESSAVPLYFTQQKKSCKLEVFNADETPLPTQLYLIIFGKKTPGRVQNISLPLHTKQRLS